MTLQVQESKSLVNRYRAKILENQPRERGYHVTSLVYDCLRRCYYNVTKEAKFDDVVQMKLNIGQVVHKCFRVEDATHELKLQWNGLVGAIDVYDPETGELVDLKTSFTPGQYVKELPYSHHRIQVEYYALLLAKNSMKVSKATILYVPHNVAKDVEIRPLEEVEKEVSTKVLAIKSAQETEKVPGGTYASRECKFCPFLGDCRAAGGWPENGKKTVEAITA